MTALVFENLTALPVLAKILRTLLTRLAHAIAVSVSKRT